MNRFLCIVVALTCVSANENLDDFINEINTKQNLWTAGKNFHDSPLLDLNGLLGSKKLPEIVKKTIPVVKHQINPGDIPKAFDSRNNWPNCKSIQEIRDQSHCGSCWAVSVASAISDRICIHSNATITPEISARNLLSCDHASTGCMGGYPYYAFIYWRDQGLVTGGAYGSKIGCQPYPFEPCVHHGQESRLGCSSDYYHTPECVTKCDDPSLIYDKERYFGSSAYRVEGEAQIQAEIMKYGPVTADFDVFDDFFSYKSGVYKRVSKKFKAGHSVRVIGWGEEEGTKYWLITNSWGENWGDNGLFKILRGKNECLIESEIYAGIPK